MITLLFTQLGLVILAHLSSVVVQLTAHILIPVCCSEFTELGLLLLPLKCDLLLCLGAYVLKAYSSWFVCVSVSVNPISWGSLKPSTAKCITGTVQQYLKLNSLRFLNKALFTVYHMIFSSQTPLGHIPDSPEDKYACIRSCNLKLRSIQHRYSCWQQDYAVNKLSTILVNILNLGSQIVYMLVSLLCLPNWLLLLATSTLFYKYIVSGVLWWALWQCMHVKFVLKQC